MMVHILLAALTVRPLRIKLSQCVCAQSSVSDYGGGPLSVQTPVHYRELYRYITGAGGRALGILIQNQLF